MTTLFKGALTALVTPFDGPAVDERQFADFVAWQVAEGTEGLVPCGTAGEGPTLTWAEHERLIRICVEVSAGRACVIAAAGTNATASTIALTQQAKRCGADAALLVTPYYNRPSQEGLYRHFEAVAGAVDLPLIVHNCPARTGVDLLPGTVERLSRLPQIVGICDASRDPARSLATAAAARDGFVPLCGDDLQAMAFGLAGGEGCVSVLANVVPKLCVTLQRACREARYDLAQRVHRRLLPLIAALEAEPEPASIKQALGCMRPGFQASTRLPMIGAATGISRAVADAVTRISTEERAREPAVEALRT